MIGVECPKCGLPKTQGVNYAKMADDAEKGQLRFFCAECDHFWYPDNQTEIAANLRKQSESR